LVQMEWHPARWSTSASVNLPLYHKVQKSSSGTGSPGWSRKKGRKMVVVVNSFAVTPSVKNFHEDQLNSSRILVFPGSIKNSRRFSEVVDTLM